ncbi:hypothetical protein GLAREA_00015 [Glarea lozoyensis ATCC 20868]|uniref:Uncharacterized protein n=1 Tax=Glarea lozoyensis (strain ATCC 20868 / MF5171) TaxID=1116229 RepID=S3CQZ4_GLAL2|nr:uncharacterized protein GLAREA_00015 [Glarea lozoyensis ATCC 20868]EPE28857.1 hypothetical protein GLAREA_00015 [Glarea lozoyensis ATCC 20868]
MPSPSKRSRQLDYLSTKFSNHSFSSIASGSDAGTFHSAHAQPVPVELVPVSRKSVTKEIVQAISPANSAQPPTISSVRMIRQDSGFSDGLPRSNRSSMSSSSVRRSSLSKREPKRRTTNSSLSSSTRPSTKRASRSTPNGISRSSTSSGQRPTMQQRHTTPYNQPAYQFFHFPTFTDPRDPPQVEEESPTSPPPPPATVQYWTSDSTRRLEYAAIDAASRGVKGFLIKMMPDCILPPSSRHTRFCKGDDEDEDLGSVRRYRLHLPEERCPITSGKGKGFWKGLGWGRSRRGSC